MNALEKVAWTELIVSLVAILSVLGLYPWLGERAMGAFGLLGLLGVVPLFMIRKGREVIADERDRDIERRSKSWGVGTASTFVLSALFVLAMWHDYHSQDIPTKYAFALLWMQFVILYGVKGAASLLYYRRGHRAT